MLSVIAWQARRLQRRWPISTPGGSGKVKSATFFTAQVDFAEAGDLKLFTGDETMALLDQLTKEKGFLDGRYMAATFNLLRGRDLIWSYVVNNYLLGEEPAPFDLLHWNSDTTNLPASWHRDYLESFYKGNKLAEKGGISVAGTPIDISRVKTPTYIQAGREDHIAPPQSVWKIMDHFAGRNGSCSRGRDTLRGWSIRRPRRSTNIGSTNALQRPERLRFRRDRAQGQLVAGLAPTG